MPAITKPQATHGKHYEKGATFTRLYKGELYAIQFTGNAEGRWLCSNGMTFKSLSGAARYITGKNTMDGPAFWHAKTKCAQQKEVAQNPREEGLILVLEALDAIEQLTGKAKDLILRQDISLLIHRLGQQLKR